jgi:hypothetical protein
VQKKEEDALANEADISCGVCGMRCNGTIHTCHGEQVHGYCLDESDHRTCKKCIASCDSNVATVATVSRDILAISCSSNSDNDPTSFVWTGQTSAPSECNKEEVNIINYRVLEEKEFVRMTEVAIRRLKNPSDRSDMALLCDLIGHHFKDVVIAELDNKLFETHIQKVESLSQSPEFRRGFLSFQRSVKSVADARPFPCIIIGRNR